MVPKSRSFENALKVGQVLLEALCAVGAFLLACHLWLGPVVQWEPEFAVTIPAPYLSLLLFIPLIRFVVNWHIGLRDRGGGLSLVEDLGRVLRAAFVGSMVLVCFTFLYRGGLDFRGHSYSRMVFVLDGVICTAFLYAMQMIRHRWQRALRARGGNLIPCVLVDTGRQSAYVRSQLKDSLRWGHRIVGEVHVPTADAAGLREALAPLPDLIRRTRAAEVIVSDPTISYQELVNVLMASDPGHKFSIRVLPDLRHYIPSKVAWGRVGSVPALLIFDDPIRGMNLVLKRALDFAVAGTSLVLLSPLLLVTMAAIRLDSRGPILFRQERVGLDGRRFWLHKFRSMRVDTDHSEHRRYVTGMINGKGSSAGSDGSGNGIYKLKDDPRITRVGRFIRRYSIDEIPQLFNVLRGDMSLVGPRPPVAYEVEEYTAWHCRRLSVRPGLTGLWQTMGRSRRSYNQMVKLDLFYINHWSLWLDLRILFRTLGVVLRGSDAC